MFWTGFMQGARAFGEGVASIVNVVLLFVLYAVGIGLTSLAMKFFGHRFIDVEEKTALRQHMKDAGKAKNDLGKKSAAKGTTYFESISVGNEPKENYYRQF
jgi:hypothetical protein